MDPSIFESDEFTRAVRKEVEALLGNDLKQIKEQIIDLQDSKKDKLTPEQIEENVMAVLNMPLPHYD